MSEPVFKTYAEEIAYKRGFVDGDLFAEQRIIKLLEGEMCEKDGELVECWCGSWMEAIALIKEENSKGTNE